MTIQFNTDSYIDGNEELTQRLRERITKALRKYEGRITRVEVHLADVNANKAGQKDKRCMIEARVAGIKPIAVSSYDNYIEQAVKGATIKLTSAIDSTLGKMNTYSKK